MLIRGQTSVYHVPMVKLFNMFSSCAIFFFVCLKKKTQLIGVILTCKYVEKETMSACCLNSDNKSIKAVLNIFTVNILVTAFGLLGTLSVHHCLNVTYKCQLCNVDRRYLVLVFGCVSVVVHDWNIMCMQALLIWVTFPSPSTSAYAVVLWKQHQNDNG